MSIRIAQRISIGALVIAAFATGLAAKMDDFACCAPLDPVLQAGARLPDPVTMVLASACAGLLCFLIPSGRDR